MTVEHRICIRRPDHVPLHVIVDGPLPVGRSGDGIALDDERVSRHHCELDVRDGVLVVRDLASSNGTLVDGVAVTGTVPLGVGAVVRIGDVCIEVVGPLDRAAAAPTSEPASGPGAVDELGATLVGALPADASTPVTGAGPGQVLDSLRASVVGSTLTLVITDIVDSTAQVRRLGDRAWMDRLTLHDGMTRAVTGRHQGTVVKGQGDGFLLTFPSARHALAAAVALQHALCDERDRSDRFDLHLRIGVHTGEVIHESGDVFGAHVHRAARIAAVAGPDEIVVSSLVRELTETMGDLHFGPALEVELKGFTGPHLVHRLDWAGEVRP